MVQEQNIVLKARYPGFTGEGFAKDLGLHIVYRWLKNIIETPLCACICQVPSAEFCMMAQVRQRSRDNYVVMINNGVIGFTLALSLI
jgi:hypothetical protein